MTIRINIYYPNLYVKGSDTWYIELLRDRLQEKDIEANLINDLSKQDRSIPTMIEYLPQIVKEIPNDRSYIIDVLAAPSNSRMFVEMKAMIKSPRKLVSNIKFALKNPEYASTITKRAGVLDFKELQNNNLLLVRDHHVAKTIGITKYEIAQIPNPKAKKLLDKSNKDEIHIGTVGFATRNKNNDLIAEMAQRLGIKATIIATISRENKIGTDGMSNIAKELDKYKSDKIKIITQPLSDEEIEKYLSYCTHFIFAQDDTNKPSSSLREMAKYGKPIIATQSTQAKEARVPNIVKSLNQITIEYLREKTALTYPPDGIEAMAKAIKEFNIG